MEAKKLRRKTLEAQVVCLSPYSQPLTRHRLVLDQLFARKASAFASQRQQQSEVEGKQEVASRVAQEQAKGLICV